MLDNFQSNDFFKLTTDAMIATKDGFFQMVNPAFCRILGYTEEELTSRPYIEFVHPSDRDWVTKVRNREIVPTSSVIEGRYIAKSGDTKWFSWTFVRDEKTGYSFGVGRDITDKKSSESKEENLRLQQIADSRLQAYNRLAANLAHEINNPLTVIYGQACQLRQTIERKQVSAETLKPIAESLEAMSLRIMTIINGLQILSDSAVKVPFVMWPVKTLLEETIKLCRGEMGFENIKLDIPNVPENWVIHCRPAQVCQALLNVIHNAFDAVANAEKKWITVAVQQNLQSYDIAITDSGSPLSQEAKANLFKPFFSTKPIGKGTGLGLNIARTICQEHGGHLTFSSDTQHTTFVLNFPRPTI